ncbi:unnamed protein product [Mytilus coruscus]|uniref:Uncharacterized protein n=1 Tax=Mytilus coruscus TaxID=42192 RepID=A0A6J8BEI7_MYTCO|nr:unnamed protein product [Mytilus coruscus]
MDNMGMDEHLIENQKRTFWVRNRTLIYTAGGLIVGCFVTVGISYLFFSLGKNNAQGNVQTNGSKDNVVVKWQDFDKKMNVLTLHDEEQPFERKLPNKDLFKWVTEINLNSKKLFVVNLYYTTNKCHIQGTKSKLWVEQEYEVLNKLVQSLITNSKGNNPETDNFISEITFPKFLVPEGEALNNSQTLLKCVHEYEQNETLVDDAHNANNTTVTESAISENIQGVSEQNEEEKLTENKVNCNCQKDIQQLQNSLHKIEQILVEKSNTELLVLQKSEHILLQLENISTKLEQKEENACMIENIQKDLKSEISKVSAVFQDKKSLTVEISEDYMDKLNESRSQMATNLKLETNKISSQLTKDALEILKVSEENTKKIITAVNDNTDSESSDDEDSDSNPSSTEVTFAKNKEKHIHTRDSIENQLSKQKDNVDKTTQDKLSDKQDYQPILNDKVSPFKQTDRNFDVDCWIIGTSVVKDLIARKIYRSKRVRTTTLKEKTIRGAKAFIKTGKVSAANILLQVGSNDVDFDYDIENVAKEMRDLISFCKLSVPGVKFW